MRGWFPPIFSSWLCGSALDFVVLFSTLRFCSCLRLFWLCVTNSSFRESGPVIGELKMESWELGVAELECRVGTCICNLWVESCKFYIQNNKTSIKSIYVIESMLIRFSWGEELTGLCDAGQKVVYSNIIEVKVQCYYKSRKYTNYQLVNNSLLLCYWAFSNAHRAERFKNK